MKAVVEQYLDIFFNTQLDFKAVRALLTDDFTFQGPLMSADNADDFIMKLRGFGDNIVMNAEIHEVIHDGNTAVARYDFLLPGNIRVPAAEWYTVRNDKIECMYLYRDPKHFMQGQE